MPLTNCPSPKLFAGLLFVCILNPAHLPAQVSPAEIADRSHNAYARYGLYDDWISPDLYTTERAQDLVERKRLEYQETSDRFADVSPERDRFNRDAATEFDGDSDDAAEKAKSGEVDPTTPVRLTGEVVSVKQIDVRGVLRRIATIKSKQGRSLAVDLGRPREFKQQLNEGDKLVATGRLTRSGDDLVLVARRYQIGDNEVQQTSTRLGDRVQGTIARIGTRRLGEKTVRLITVETADQQRVTADLGAAAGAEISLKTEQEIMLHGIMTTTADGEDILVATHVKPEAGETLRIRQQK